MVFTPVDKDMVFTPVDKDMVFTPVDMQWQKVCASVLAIHVRKDLCMRFQHHQTTQTNSAYPCIHGDGNCLFQSISHFLTGTQSEHKFTCQLALDYMKDNSPIFCDTAHATKHPDMSNMDSPEEWSTEVEIFAFASMLGPSIVVFGPSGVDQTGTTIHKWLTYSPHKALHPISGLSPSTKIMFLSSKAGHFE